MSSLEVLQRRVQKSGTGKSSQLLMGFTRFLGVMTFRTCVFHNSEAIGMRVVYICILKKISSTPRTSDDYHLYYELGGLRFEILFG